VGKEKALKRKVVSTQGNLEVRKAGGNGKRGDLGIAKVWGVPNNISMNRNEKKGCVQ